MAVDLRLHVSMVAPFPVDGFYGGTSEIMRTIIARDLTGLRA
jgi:hypothetical protein